MLQEEHVQLVNLPARPIPQELLQQQTPELILSETKFLANLRWARRGAAAGPSGCTTEHLRVLLDTDADAHLLYLAAILAGFKLGRLVALRKPDGGVRGLIMGDTFRRLVARTLAQQFAPAFETACLPYQYALSTRAGAEALARTLRLATETDPRATLLSVDGVGAYDHVSRQAMLTALATHPTTAALLPLARSFYGAPSEYVWYDQSLTPHTIAQGEGGEQGDPLMPAFFNITIHSELQAISHHLQPGEALLAYLDDLYVISPPTRTVPIFHLLDTNLREHAGISLHLGKTRIWNAAGEEPTDAHTLQPAAQAAPIWTGAWTLPPSEQGLTALGTPHWPPRVCRSGFARQTRHP